VHFKQIFYSVSAERPVKPADIFSKTTTWEDIVRAGISEKYTPIFVKNVQYGTQI
jgi:thiol-activated cytolysin